MYSNKNKRGTISSSLEELLKYLHLLTLPKHFTWNIITLNDAIKAIKLLTNSDSKIVY